MAIPEESLQDFLDEQQGITKPGFMINDDKKADWALKKLSSIRAQQAKVAKDAQEEISQIEKWKTEQTERLEKDAEFFISQLISYATIIRSENPEFKSLPLPHGKIGFRKQQPQWAFDQKIAVEGLKAAGYQDLIRIREEPDKAAAKKKLAFANGKAIDKLTGEIIPGITVEEREDKPIIEVK
ncbi:MAG: host-nuclease inhibitor Gam family protein [Sporolactobacillus sp.]